VAHFDERHPDGVAGDWYADTRCIACDVARHYAPGLIAADQSGLSVVVRQPQSSDDEAALWRAALACPTQSIGTRSRRRPPPGVFPWRLTEDVYLCGYNDPSSFGAHSYLVVREGGNLLVDSPRYTGRLVDRMVELGGVAHVLLSHRDDVADADRYATRFGARVWIHEADASAAPYATDILRGDEMVAVAPGVRAIPVPGHTRGSVVFEDDRGHLFTGDSLAWSAQRGGLDVFGSATWYSWEALTESMGRLAGVARFSWVLPGHGKWGHADAEEMTRQLAQLAEDMGHRTAANWDRRARRP
jgi:glyoxylase-like metal-dependent hydrolase (beta-lactamase superfamily II)/ferredoxin